jgi:hypothetical protein
MEDGDRECPAIPGPAGRGVVRVELGGAVGLVRCQQDDRAHAHRAGPTHGQGQGRYGLAVQNVDDRVDVVAAEGEIERLAPTSQARDRLLQGRLAADPPTAMRPRAPSAE